MGQFFRLLCPSEEKNLPGGEVKLSNHKFGLIAFTRRNSRSQMFFKKENTCVGVF